MKRNLLIGAAVASVLLAGTAQAISLDANNHPVFDTSAAGDTRVVYISGASAAATFLEKVLTGSGVAADQICDISKPIWKFKDNIDGSTQKAYLCTQAAQATATNLVLATDKPNLLIMKRDEGGSGYGVSPIISEANGDVASSLIEFMNVNSSNCGAAKGLTATSGTPANGALTNIICDYSPVGATAGNNQLVTPDAGISDVDPGAFKGVNAPFKTDNATKFADVTSADVAKLTVTPGAAVTFGAAVTTHLYRALQGAQLAAGIIPANYITNHTTLTTTACTLGATNAECMPTLSKEEIASLHAGYWNNWDKLKVNGIGLATWATNNQLADAPASNVTHVCRRENGSGTQAQSNNFALGYPCSTASAILPAVGNDGLGGNLGNKTEASSVALIHENSTSGRVTACLKDLNLGLDTAGDGFVNPYFSVGVPSVRWAIGIHALEKSDANFKFVKINGVAPTIQNVANGSYLDWFENTFQYNTNHAKFLSDAGLKTTIDAIIKAATVPAVMASINASLAYPTYLGNPKANTAPASGTFDATNPVNPYSHTPAAATALDNCRAPVVYNKAAVGL